MEASDIKTLFSERLRELMREQNLNQSQLASKIGLRQNTVSTWVLGKKTPGITALWLLADSFGITIDYLVGRTDY